MRLLDLFCGAGGAAMGYHRAGFDEIIGVDWAPQRHYPFKFVQMSAFNFRIGSWDKWDAIHASPPCQAHTALRTAWNAKPHTDVIPDVRALLQTTTLPYVIENVPNAPLLTPILLCGSHFKLGTADAELRRHRLFESNVLLQSPGLCKHGQNRQRTIGVYDGHGRNRQRVPTIGVYGGGHGESLHRGQRGQRNYTADEQREAMGIDWMTVNELSQAVPPAYTEFIGRQILQSITGVIAR